jgi:hypothetical protein
MHSAVQMHATNLSWTLLGRIAIITYVETLLANNMCAVDSKHQLPYYLDGLQNELSGQPVYLIDE